MVCVFRFQERVCFKKFGRHVQLLQVKAVSKFLSNKIVETRIMS